MDDAARDELLVRLDTTLSGELGVVQTLIKVNERLDNGEDRFDAIENQQTKFKAYAGIVATVTVVALADTVKGWLSR